MGYQPELIGGHVALDLVNTVSWRLDDARWIDRITSTSALADWCTAVGLVYRPGTLQQVRTVREVVYGVLLPLARGNEPAKADLSALRGLVAGALAEARPKGIQPLDWEAADLPAALALAAARLLEHEDLGRLHECQDGDCGWLFLDRSKNGSRRWCSSGDCGNRARARRHYQRTHGMGA
ncbi:CGNR zinc finger domain-containing protein [Kribbella sancticallisti]|uniref:CGNR zinc finger domain-containing protein n=1 Tax=Kribbella sancticallisti TaxID=460087 RepID=A0ABP4PVM4_9ACTN